LGGGKQNGLGDNAPICPSLATALKFVKQSRNNGHYADPAVYFDGRLENL